MLNNIDKIRYEQPKSSLETKLKQHKQPAHYNAT